MGYTGVQQKDGRVRIWFNWEGKRVFEPLDLKPTTSNLKQAARLRAEIVQQIKLDAFDYAAYFPDSPRAETSSAPTFYEFAKRWIDSQTTLSPSTISNYKKIVNRYWLPPLHDRPIDKIEHSELLDLLNSHEWSSPKTRNNAITPLRQILEFARTDKAIDSNPAEGLKFAKHQKPLPDPLTPDEVSKVLEYFREHDPHWLPYFQLAFFTGLRTSELIALKPNDIYWDLDLISVSRAYVNQQIKPTKTYEARDVELNSMSREALQNHDLTGEWIFTHPANGRIINNDKPPRLAWTEALKETGIRHRNAYQTRHTYATMNIMAGANPMWVAQQMGHRNMKMILEHYARWIKAADLGREKTKIEDTITAHFSAHS